ncbi:MAG: hypothetical protein U9P44_02030, partial [archaeon]|nr:hypothetical protein [archaeon]
VKAYDYFIQEDYIYNKKYFLREDRYPWINETLIEGFVSGLTDIGKKGQKTGISDIDEDVWYYTVWTIDFEKTVFNVISNGQPTPLEDGTWVLHGYIATKNMLMMKLLERKCEAEKTEKEINDMINMDKDKYFIDYCLMSETGPYKITKNEMYDKKNDILKGKKFKRNAEKDEKIEVDGKVYTKDDFLLAEKQIIVKIWDNNNNDINGRDDALEKIKNEAQNKLSKLGDFRSIEMRRVSAPKRKKMTFGNSDQFLKNFGINLKFNVEKGPYQSEFFDFMTQGLFKLAGSEYWGKTILKELYQRMNIPW